MQFCTVINCMDGRTQLPVIDYLKTRFNATYVDSITEAGPNKIVATGGDTPTMNGIHTRIGISVEKHGSTGIAIVGHHDCAGNPCPEETQTAHTEAAVQALKQAYPQVEVIGLWVDENWNVHELVS